MKTKVHPAPNFSSDTGLNQAPADVVGCADGTVVKLSNSGTVRCGVNVIGGFLGSGKTTLLRHFLSTPKLPEKVALLINEIGEVVIDAKLLKTLGSGVVELPNGCICCTVTGDFIQALLDIKKNYSPDRILIEPTGIAEPGKILSALYRPPLESEFRVEPTVIIIDAAGFEKLYRQLAYLYVMQIKSADLILLNKTDLVKSQEISKVEKEIKKLNPKVFIFHTSFCKVDLLNLVEGKTPLRPPFSKGGDRGGHEHFECFSYESKAIFSKEKIEKFLSRLPANVFRFKGFVRTEDGAYLLNYLTGQSEWEKFEEQTMTSLTCVGKNLPKKKIESEFKKCVIRKNSSLL